jgi:aerobic-type carbon monoxide dehydrogenase small subunit (CoxS/CutS family)
MIQLKVNDLVRNFDGDPEMPLLWYLRDVLGLTGTKFGCGVALCRADSVHKNGEALKSCIPLECEPSPGMNASAYQTSHAAQDLHHHR